MLPSATHDSGQSGAPTVRQDTGAGVREYGDESGADLGVFGGHLPGAFSSLECFIVSRLQDSADRVYRMGHQLQIKMLLRVQHAPTSLTPILSRLYSVSDVVDRFCNYCPTSRQQGFWHGYWPRGWLFG